ncbi:MAG TPA: DnaA regulatory inactivator Hda [Gammaproteobacteria bacterium]|nr:DnaA regulatory inactivator Hda [Gammaproteobacteria bacterium]
MRQLPLGVQLPDHATFRNFHAGPNRACVDYMRALAERGGAPAAWLWGPPAAGKTHLLMAICALALEHGRRAACVSLDRVHGSEAGVLAGLGDCAVVCIDDLEHAAGDATREAALFELFNRLQDAGGAMVAASGRSPAALSFALPDLASRLRSGGVFGLGLLDDEDRLAALRLRARHRGLVLPDDTGAYLLRRVPRDMSSLYRLLDSLDREALAAGRLLTVPFVRRVLADRGRWSSPSSPGPAA